ncbi:unnamed protein product [Peronospora farinosa]|uniref:Mediator complex subunit 15 KIX domain-containing protein n=1 Tax=Peronospora farinosa TaxID=134698 RepID=A0AAV0TUY3_9STRA|nr:unnamed protein product [Peronospora farinosa]CAI5726109.1 unnamed protein product [Peronospora farinosa]
MEGQWRSEIPEDMRKTMITEMYHELARISGEVDKQKVWGSAAKFELMLWSSSPDRNSYLMKMQRKIVSLKKKQGAGDANLMANANNVVTSNSMNPAVNGMAHGLNMNMNATMNAQFQQNNAVASQAMNNFQQQAQVQPQSQVQAHAQAQVQAQAQAQQQNAAALAASNGATVGASTGFNAAVAAGLNSSNAGPTAAANIPTPPQQQAQQWLQRIQVQFQAQQRQLMHTQNQETQQLRQQHMNQQQQLSQQQQQQGVAPDMRRQQLQTLQQQHQLARTRLQHLHKSKQQQLQRKQQQYLMQKQHQLQQQQQQGSVAAATATASTNGVSSTAMMAPSQAGVAPSSLSLPNATTVQTSAPTVSTTQAAATLPTAQRGVKPEQLADAHTQQAAMRDMQRAQNAAQIHADNGLTHQLFNGTAASTASSTPTGAAKGTVTATTTATTTDSSNQTYVERLKETKQKYWDDLVIVYREFERMVKQKPANQQQERINTFLVNLKRIIALLQQDPLKVTSNNKNDLDRVEAHIQKQVLPILERLKNKTRAAAATAGNNGLAAAQQEQMKKTQEAQRLAQLQEQQKKMQEQQKAEAQRKLLEEQKKKLQLEAAAAAAAVKKQEMLEQQRKQKQKQLQAQHAQQQAILQQQQQQRQRLLAQQAQLKAQNQLRMNAAAPQQAKTAAGTVDVTPSAIANAGGDLTTTSTTNGTDVSPTNASLPTPIDVPVSLSPGETSTSSGMAPLTPAQYRTFKLPEARKQQLTAQHAKLREQQQELIMQQSRAKTPSHQAKLAHQAQRLAQMTNKISQQLVQCKLAEEYEQSKSMGMATAVSQPTLAQSTATPASLDKTITIKPEIAASGNGLATSASEVTAPATTLAVIKDETAAVSAVAATVPGMTAKKNDDFKSVLPDMTGLGASEKLLTAVAAYEKHKPDVLKRGALRFSRIAVTIGAKLNTSYVTS